MTGTAATTNTNSIEWPTLIIACVIYGAFGLLTWNYDLLAWWLVVPLAGYLLAWHGSLQHEAVHCHPTRWPLLNEALVFPSLWLWMPYRLYRKLHLAHHVNDRLTDPLEDPESYYLSPEAWAHAGPLHRGFLTLQNSAAGRLLLGPLYCCGKLFVVETARLLKGDTGHLGFWILHLAGAALALVWVMGVCGIGFVEYLAFFVYPSISLTLLRSFLEHQAREEASERSVIIEAELPMSLLYLNNNLHAVHHETPGTAWYRLPALYQARKNEILAENGGYFFKGYAQVVARYLFRPKEPVLHPFAGTRAPRPSTSTALSGLS
jgi:fatty acid desaturase